MGKRILLPLAAALLLTGCSSMQHIENGSSIDEAQPTTTAPAQTTAPPPAILTNRCPNPKYRQYTLIKETEV